MLTRIQENEHWRKKGGGKYRHRRHRLDLFVNEISSWKYNLHLNLLKPKIISDDKRMNNSIIIGKSWNLYCAMLLVGSCKVIKKA